METIQAKSKLAKNVFLLTVVQVAIYVLPLISVPVVSRIIGPGNYGIINFAAAFISYFTLIISYSFEFSASRRIIKDLDNRDHRNTVFTEVFYTQCFLFLVSTIAFAVLLVSIPEFRKNYMVFLFSYLLCFSTLFTQNWLFQAMQDLSKVALLNFVSRLLFTIAILIAVRKPEDYIWQPLLIGVIQGAIALCSFFWAKNKYGLTLKRLNISRIFQVLSEDKTIFISLVFVNLYSGTNTVILGLYANSEQVGYFTAGQRLIIIAQSVLTMPLAQALYPFVAKAFKEGKEHGIEVAQKIIPLIALFLGGAFLIMVTLGPWMIVIFYGAKFEPSALVFQLLALVPLLFSLNNVLGIQIMVNLQMDKQFLKVTAAAAIFSVTTNLILIRYWGYLGTAVNMLCTEMFIFICMYLVLRKSGINPINFKYFNTSLLREYATPMVNTILKKTRKRG
ncbi:flippase [Dyadobacter luticola]|uniref:Flippase n=1 Tax=Dyadobacter luticola TaxID=1979387 RepID=A0A5R9L3R4_9BACT|nr:flippase [Dyadobacter luticola]TLV03222.1 flippase [Dyadobacter luticola]